ncbi:inositol monophosphatase family protein [Aggregatilineales bacterium SYSU G02658]
MSITPLIDAVRDAVTLCRTLQAQAVQGINKFSQAKGSSEPVTIADYGAQALIGRALMQHFPDDGVISEESGQQFASLVSPERQQAVIAALSDVLGLPVSVDEVIEWLDFGKERRARRVWVIDPIDGTRGFIAGRHYAICVGLLVDGHPSAGVIGAPMYADGAGAIFYGDEGGLHRLNLATGHAERVHVSTRQDPSEWVAVQSYEDAVRGQRDAVRVLTQAGWIDRVPVRDIDSMEKYALVACGDADMMIRLPQAHRSAPHMIWDHAAGIALVLAGGGTATDFDGSPLDFTQGKVLPNQGMIVSSGVMHAELVEAARTVGGVKPIIV